jgi:Reverse transcriptase (RNA-dependent DNA polymerase)
MLFNIALERIVRRSREDTIFTKSTQMLGFADDIDIIGRNTRVVKDTYSKLEREANRIGLHVNEEKTKFPMMCPSQQTKNLVGSHLEIGDKFFKMVKQFKYLRALVND